jgi:hypothetical protein
MNETDHTIINYFGAEYRGIVQYYLLAGDVYRLDRLHWVMQTSLLKTLAGKYGSTVTTMARAGTRPRSRRRTGHTSACKPGLSAARDANRWSQCSVVSRSNGRSTRPSETARQSRPPPLAKS